MWSTNPALQSPTVEELDPLTCPIHQHVVKQPRQLPDMGSRPKRTLQGAAKEKSEAKKARTEAARDPIQVQRDHLAAAAAASGTIDEARTRIEGYDHKNKKDKTGRILDECLKGFPKEGRDNLIVDILGRDDEGLQTLASEIRSCIFIPLKAKGGKTPAPSPSPSVSSSSSTSGKGKESMIKQATKPRSRQARLKKACLARDSNRCVVSGTHDDNMAEALLSTLERDKVRAAPTQCCHIIPYSAAPESTGENVDTIDLQQKAKTWAYLYRYFPRVKELIDVRLAGAIDTPQNAMTLMSDIHSNFGDFKLAFEAIDMKEHTYKLQSFKFFPQAYEVFLPKDRIVKFTSANGTDLPDPDLLAFHLAIANILHATGMGEEIDRLIDDMEAGEDLPEGTGLETRVNEWLMATA
ncbi:hypothetical protein AWENTII_008897 [Aspergillus wentii]